MKQLRFNHSVLLNVVYNNQNCDNFYNYSILEKMISNIFSHSEFLYENRFTKHITANFQNAHANNLVQYVRVTVSCNVFLSG